MVTLYITGPITGIVDYEARFADAQKRLEAAGYGAINPVSLAHANPDDWVSCLRLDIATMMRKAYGLALLSGWLDSKGAFLEVTIARSLEMPVLCLEAWLGERGAYTT